LVGDDGLEPPTSSV